MIIAPQCGTNSRRDARPDDLDPRGEAYLGVLVHELGHNLGLDHANSLICTKSARRVPQAGKCYTEEYGDMWDAMGISSQQYSVPVLRRLGWAGRIASAAKSDTWTLRDAAHSGRGIQALRVPSGGSTYWLEYRTDPHAMTKSPGTFAVTGVPGLQIRLDTGARSLRILDAAPGNPDANLTYPDPDLVNPALPEGSSFTTPQKVRITLESQDISPTVRITRGIAAQAPDAPTITSAVSSPASARSSHGAAGEGQRPGDARVPADQVPRGKVGVRLEPGGDRHHAVDVWDQRWCPWSMDRPSGEPGGTSPESAKTSVHVIAPTMAITSPAPEATVPAELRGHGERVARPDRQVVIEYVQVCVVGAWCDVDETAPYAFTVSASVGADDAAGHRFRRRGWTRHDRRPRDRRRHPAVGAAHHPDARLAGLHG